jgi:hypothetical protein
MQEPANNNRGMVFSARSAKQKLNSSRKAPSSKRSVSRSYKQDNSSNELVVGYSPADKNINTEAEDIVGIRHQATTGEDITG